MLSYVPTITSTDNNGRLKLGSARAISPTGLFFHYFEYIPFHFTDIQMLKPIIKT